MAKSLKKMVTDAAELVAIAGLTVHRTVAVWVSPCGIRIHLDPLELVRVSRLFNVSRSKVDVSDDGDDAIHVHFPARGATWCCVIWKKDAAEFYASLGGDLVKLMDQRARRLAGRRPPSNLLPAADIDELLGDLDEHQAPIGQKELF